MVSGNEQTGAAGQPLAQPIVVRVLDSRGRGRSGVEIYWVVSLGRGYVTTATSSTDSEGQASAIWTLGFLATTQTVSAVAGDTTVSPAERRVTFSATAIGVANRLELVSGDNQTALTDDSLSLPLVVRLVNENGVGIGGVGVYWLSNGGHVFPRGSPLTDADGYARATWIAGLSAGAQTASANVYDFVTPGPLFSVQFTATVQLPPQALTWTREAQGVTTANLFGVWGSSATDVFVVGESGTILHYDGVGWIKQASGTTARLRDVWGTGPTNVYVAGDSGIPTTMEMAGPRSGLTPRSTPRWQRCRASRAFGELHPATSSRSTALPSSTSMARPGALRRWGPRMIRRLHGMYGACRQSTPTRPVSICGTSTASPGDAVSTARIVA